MCLDFQANMNGQRRRNPKKKGQVEIPEYVSSQFSHMEHLVKHSLFRKWMSYEWQYDEIDDMYFNQYRTFRNLISTKFPRLKSVNLNRFEWRKIRNLVSTRKTRRFSSKFVLEQRVDLEKYRQRMKVLQDNRPNDELAKLNGLIEGVVSHGIGGCVEQPHFEVCRLIVKLKHQLSAKRKAVADLRKINSFKNGFQNMNDNESNVLENGNAPPNGSTEAIASLLSCNVDIASSLVQLIQFQIAKDALLFDALNKKKVFLTLSPTYFRRKCELRIHESHRDYNTRIFLSANNLLLVGLLLEQFLIVCDYEQLAENANQFFRTIAKEHSATLRPIVDDRGFEKFMNLCLQLLDNIIEAMICA